MFFFQVFHLIIFETKKSKIATGKQLFINFPKFLTVFFSKKIFTLFFEIFVPWNFTKISNFSKFYVSWKFWFFFQKIQLTAIFAFLTFLTSESTYRLKTIPGIIREFSKVDPKILQTRISSTLKRMASEQYNYIFITPFFGNRLMTFGALNDFWTASFITF